MNSFELKGKVVIVTGGGGSIGFRCVQRCLDAVRTLFSISIEDCLN